MVRYLFYTIGDLTYQSPLVIPLMQVCCEGTIMILILQLLRQVQNQAVMRRADNVTQMEDEEIHSILVEYPSHRDNLKSTDTGGI